jgi:acyl-CoA thioester hydrolase
VIHETTVRVRYPEVDRMGVVYHAHYLVYFEQGRTEFLRSQGPSYREVEEGGLLLVVADVGVRYLRPARYDDLLTVRTRITSLSGVRIRFEYEVVRSADGCLLATGHTTLASTDLEGRPVRLPDAVQALLHGVAELDTAAGAPSPGGSGAHGGKNVPPATVQGRNP